MDRTPNLRLETIMTISQPLKDQLCKKLRMVGLPRDVVLPLVNDLTRQIAAEGAENVVKRLKLLKQAAINHLAGVPYKFPWIKHDSTGPKGSWKPVWRLLNSSKQKHRKRAFNAMMVYASLVLPKRAGPTSTQERKFLDSVVQTSEEVKLRAEGVDAILNQKSFRSAMVRMKNFCHSHVYRESEPHEISDYFELAAKKFVNNKVRLAREERNFLSFLGTDVGRAFQPFPEIQRAIGQHIVDDYRELVHPYHNFDSSWEEAMPPTEPIGVVGSSQEPGMKFRAFASPHLVTQAALDPMKKYLLGILKSLPWDCTHDQDKGVEQVKTWLATGKTVFSVDLSDATNNFPLSLQLEVLKFTCQIPPSTMKLFELVSRSPYRLMWDKTKCVSWNVGQPLGAGPSFPVFALSHAVLALTAEAMVGYQLGQVGTSFLILGDDIVINDADVHEKYRSLLATLRCPISEAKCLTSNVAAEFAGKLVTRWSTYHGWKYKDVSDVSFLSVLRTLGQQAISRELLSKEQMVVAEMLKEVPEPYGLGFNPSGKSLSERMEYFYRLEEALSNAAPDDGVEFESQLLNTLAYTWKEHRLYRVVPLHREAHEVLLNEARTGRSESRVEPELSEERIRIPRSNPRVMVEAHKATQPGKPVTAVGIEAVLTLSSVVAATVARGDPRKTEKNNSLKLRKLQKALATVRSQMANVTDDPCPTPVTEGQTNQQTLSLDQNYLGSEDSGLTM